VSGFEVFYIMFIYIVIAISRAGSILLFQFCSLLFFFIKGTFFILLLFFLHFMFFSTQPETQRTGFRSMSVVFAYLSTTWTLDRNNSLFHVCIFFSVMTDTLQR